MSQVEVITPRPKNTKVKSDRYWFRVNGDDKAYVKNHMKEDDAADYFRECMARLVKTLKRRVDAKNKRKAKKKVQ